MIRCRFRVKSARYPLIRTETIGCMQIFYSADTFLVERRCIGGCMEVEITYIDSASMNQCSGARTVTSKDFITSFTSQDHLDTHGLDLATEEIHWRACPHGGHIVGFQVVYYIRNGV